ncbi:MAG: HAD family phosphatase [Armatimonadetes bacterium]|nr:HAD family phosphatase [Armatimonadota bacterium]
MTTPEDIKLVAIDLDGTLLNDDLVVAPRTAEAVRAAADLGVIVAIATGRMHVSAEPFALELGLDAPIISYNGAMIRRAREIEPLWQLPVPADLAAEVVELCVRERLDLLYFLGDGILVSRYDRWPRRYFARTGVQARPYGDLRRLAGNEPIKLLIMDEPEPTRERYDVFVREYGDRLHVTISLPDHLELLHHEVSKASALKRLAEMLGLQMAQVMAIGDNLNDLEMIRAAGVGVMMRTAGEELRAEADFVPDSGEAGVAEAIERLILEPAGVQ